ncbi:MAG TPA: hypothetical protein VFS97_15270 [Nitrososphaeraceae archaeon]|nr:hypothetical protein [Nitrososphaeraceae archaeon]
MTSPNDMLPFHIALAAIAAIPVRATTILYLVFIHPYINLRRKTSSFNHIIFLYVVTVKVGIKRWSSTEYAQREQLIKILEEYVAQLKRDMVEEATEGPTPTIYYRT